MSQYAAPLKDMQFVIEKLVGLADITAMPACALVPLRIIVPRPRFMMKFGPSMVEEAACVSVRPPMTSNQPLLPELIV